LRPRDRTPLRAVSRGGIAGVLLAAALAAVAPAASDLAPTRVRVVDAYGTTMTTGSVVFCPLEAECLEFPIASDGTITLDHGQLTPQAAYTIMVYDLRRTVVYATFDWVYDPARFRPAPGAERGVPRLRGTLSQEVEFDFSPEAAAAVPETSAASASRPGDWSRWAVGGGVSFIYGAHFDTDLDALGGVTDVAPGVSVFGAWRFLGDAPAGRTAVGFREFSVNYSLNRYTVLDAGSGDPSDVSLHRLSLAYGLGRLTARTQVTGAVALGYAGVYDGNDRLESGDRTYGMVGFGVLGRCGYRLLGGGAHGLGLVAQGELMYYPADTDEGDHWYGLAASVAVGLMVQ